ncbi:hypothetical protein ACFLZH_04510, partial [Patescibacteria group bacterium]
MATRRMILKIDAESPQWMSLTIRQRYLYWCLTLFADDDGITPTCYVRTRIIFPEDETEYKDILQDLSDLQVEGLIYNYQGVDHEQYIIICRWWDKQFIDSKLYKETDYPIPDKYYLSRPENLTKKRAKPTFYDSSSIVLDQNRVEE